MSHGIIWLAIGLVAQGMFSLRFLVQWIASERAGRSVVPVAFWYLSLLGGGSLLAYAIHRLDPVFILGQSLGFLIYGRNLFLVYAERARQGQTSGAKPSTNQQRVRIDPRPVLGVDGQPRLHPMDARSGNGVPVVPPHDGLDDLAVAQQP